MAYNYTDEVFKIRGWHGCDGVPFGVVERSVLLLLAHHANKETGECFPSFATLASETYFSVRAVSRAIGRITELGILTIDRDRRNSNTYTLDLERIREIVALCPNKRRGKSSSDGTLSLGGKKYHRLEPSDSFPVETEDQIPVDPQPFVLTEESLTAWKQIMDDECPKCGKTCLACECRWPCKTCGDSRRYDGALYFLSHFMREHEQEWYQVRDAVYPREPEPYEEPMLLQMGAYDESD